MLFESLETVTMHSYSIFCVQKYYVVIGHCDAIRELGNCCHAGLLYFQQLF